MGASEFEGLWRGDNGAEIRLLQSGDAISGTYTAKASDPTVPSRGRILVGSAEGDVIGFVTSGPAPHKIMSWIGCLIRPDDISGQELHASYHTVDRSPSDLSAAYRSALDTIVFTKVHQDSKSSKKL